MRIDGERGSVTAEFAVVLPAVLLVLVLCVGSASVSLQRIAVQSAASAAARAAARGEAGGSAEAAAARAGGGGAVSLRRDGDFVCATVSATASFAAARTLGIRVSGTSCALAGASSE
jgi:Flp pilus assembly protein TadG